MSSRLGRLLRAPRSFGRDQCNRELMEKNPRMDVIVVGGGIAGSTIALSLHQAGVKVRVYEAVREMAPLGVGINLQPTAVRELVELGIGKELANAGNETHLLSYFNKLGQHIYTEKRGIEAGYNWPQYSIHRGEVADAPTGRGSRSNWLSRRSKRLAIYLV